MKALMFLILILASSTTYGSEFRCVIGAVERVVKLDFPGKQHLCEVAVTNEDGVRDVKWFANNDSSFCSDKIVELVGKYRNQWNYTCEEIVPTPTQTELSERYQRVVDSLIKDATEEGLEAEIPFTVTATRVRSTELEASSVNALVVQLFMNAVDESITTPVDRTYFIEDDGTQFRTKSVWSGLRHKVTLDDDNYLVDSARINATNGKGEIEVETLLQSANESDTAGQNCKGTQLLLTTESGELSPIGQHRYTCN